MIPGITSKLSEGALDAAATINPKTDIVRLTGNTAISTITPNFGGGFSGILFVVPLTASVATNTAGNVQNAVTMPQNQVTVLVYSKAAGKWYAGAIS
jgi:hypothetical protein